MPITIKFLRKLTNLPNKFQAWEHPAQSFIFLFSKKKSYNPRHPNFPLQRTISSLRINARTNIAPINIQRKSRHCLFTFDLLPLAPRIVLLISIYRRITITWLSIALFQTPITPEIRRGGWPDRYLRVSRWYDSHGIRDQARERTAKARAVPEYVIIIGKLGLPSDTYTCTYTYKHVYTVCMHTHTHTHTHIYIEREYRSYHGLRRKKKNKPKSSRTTLHFQKNSVWKFAKYNRIRIIPKMDGSEILRKISRK